MKTISKMIDAKSVLVAVFAMVSFTQAWAQPRVNASAGRSEYIEVEPNVKLHVTDLGEGKPVVLIHGWPLSDAMYEYQYQD